MIKKSRGSIPYAIGIFVLLLVATTAVAQVDSGNVHGRVSSTSAGTLPGVTIELAGIGATLVRTTDSEGEFHFLGLAPGIYELTATLEGFSTVVVDTVDVRVGRNTSVELPMVLAIAEAIEVTADSPLLDRRRISTGASITRTELEKIPTARDPWVILQSVPLVLTTAVNVGGNKSGMQQGFTGAGSVPWDNTYSVDGVVITDLTFESGGSSPTYYDFDSFEEIEVATGGTEMMLATGGVTLNMVTRRGTNEWRGSARYIVADNAWQSTLSPDPGSLGEGQAAFSQGDRIVRIEEQGFESGGPLIRDRLWLWGHYSTNDIDRLTIYDSRDFARLEHIGLKLNAQLGAADSSVLFFEDSRKSVDGRGAAPDRPQPTTQNQRGGTKIFKLEDTHVLGQNLFVTGVASYVDGAFTLTPHGGIDGPNAIQDEYGDWHDNFMWGRASRPQRQIRFDASAFFPGTRLSHELRFGAGYRDLEDDEASGWPGDVIRLTSPYYDFAIVTRQDAAAFTTEYTNFFVQDTLRTGRLTANVGLRYDRQGGRLDSVVVPGVPGFETLPDGTPLLPEISFQGRDQGFTWENIVPRLGLTYAVGENRKTLVRASYSHFARQLDQFYSRYQSPIRSSYAYFYYDDTNGDGRVTADEIIDFESGPIYWYGPDPVPTTTGVEFDPNYKAVLSKELILGIEHSFLPDLVVGLHATWRNESRWEEDYPIVEVDGVVRPLQRSDYELLYVDAVTRPDGSTIEVPVYDLRNGVRRTGRSYFTNGGRETNYRGLSLTVDKAMANDWMLRGHVSWSDWTWHVPESDRINPNRGWEGYDDGGPVLWGTTPGWSYRLGGLVRIAPQRPWTFDLAGNLWGRQGYALPYKVRESLVPSWRSVTPLAVDPADEFRLPDVHLVDLSVSRPLRIRGVEATIGIDCFNALNVSTVLDREARLRVPTTNWVWEVVSPRVFRLNLRVSFP